MSEIREPSVAGRFYPGQAQELEAVLQNFMPAPQPRPAIGAVSPHAGYVYSGAVAGATLAAVEITPTVLVLCPKHTPLGEGTALMNRGAWRLPLGDIPLDEELADYLLERLRTAKVDGRAHAREHSLEVQLPFLQYLRPDVRMVPLALGYRPLKACQQLGSELGEALRQWKEPVLIVASSDMNHYQDHQTTLRKDQLALDRFLEQDAAGLHQVCEIEDISMCGVIPATVLLVAGQILGAREAELIQHTTSGEISGDLHQVVGYAGLVLR